MAGVALGHIDLRFAWQGWRLWDWAGSGGALGAFWWRVTPRHFCVSGVALGDIHLHFAWQGWHLVTSTFVLRGRGTCGTGHGSGGALGAPWSRVTPRHFWVVAVGNIHLHFAWQAWHLVTSTFVLRGRRGAYGTGLGLVARLGPFGSA